MVATDIAARGIHVDEIALVIHADPPIEHKAYLHRSGRTARAGASGSVVTLASSEQVAGVKQLLSRSRVSATWVGIAAPERSSGSRPQRSGRFSHAKGRTSRGR